MVADLAGRAARLLGAGLRRAVPIAGGDLSEVVAVELDDGRAAVVKGAASAAIEAAMLGAIRATGAPVPLVLAYDDAALVLERLDSDGRIEHAWRHLGSVLAMLHRVDRFGNGFALRYGWDADCAFGTVAIDNGWTDSWPGFWAEKRLVTHLAQLPRELGLRIETLAADLANRLPAAPDPALLHGDLWGGNILVHDGRVTGLIDPACYYGDREVDFAMLRLFNQPGRDLFDAYGSLDPGHEARLPIYQLWPALVHLRLFGMAYRPMVERLLSAARV
jgi:fructosamine-3-kinase